MLMLHVCSILSEMFKRAGNSLFLDLFVQEGTVEVGGGGSPVAMGYRQGTLKLTQQSSVEWQSKVFLARLVDVGCWRCWPWWH